MSTGTALSTRISGELDTALRMYEQKHGLTRSQAVRFLLNAALGQGNGPNAGWWEGYIAASALITERVRDALRIDPSEIQVLTEK